MIRKTLAALAVAAAVAAAGIVYAGPGVEAQSNPRASRSFSAPWVLPGGQARVTVALSGYGSLGQLEETLPSGFAYQSSNLDASTVETEGRTVTFTLLGVDRVVYTVTASTTVGRHAFAGVLRDQSRGQHTVGGATSIRVGPAPTPTPTATPTATPTPTPEPTATPIPTATPEPTATPTATPTSTPEPTATATASPTPTATATAAPTATPTPTPEPAAAPTATPTPQPVVTPDREEGGLPAWVLALIVAAALAVLLALVAFSRRRL